MSLKLRLELGWWKEEGSLPVSDVSGALLVVGALDGTSFDAC